MSVYPSVAFYFKVTLGLNDSDFDNGFQEAGGISVTPPIEEIQEGGLNSYKHNIPSVPMYKNLMLKRGYIASDSKIADWFRKTLDSGFSMPITTQMVNLMLLNETGATLKIWTFYEAWLIKWSVSDFDVEESKLLIESLDLAYSYFNV